jgi:hypothetical protein
MALEADPVLRKEYRLRFFLCEPNAETILVRGNCPHDLRRFWVELLSSLTPDHERNLLAGPASWALTRLSSHERILLWAEREPPWSQYYVHDLRSKYNTIINSASSVVPFGEGGSLTAFVLSPQGDSFVNVLAACFLLTSRSCHNCFIADEGCAEVYQIHHHDKVVASLPDTDSREEALQHLTLNSDIYTDISGYASTIDDDPE